MTVSARLGPAVARLFRPYSEPIQRISALLAETGGDGVHARVVARRAGFRDRDTLYEALTDANLRPLTELALLVRVLNWSLRAEDDGLSPTSLAQRDGRYPAQYFHTVRRAVGKPWSEVRRLGSSWVVQRMAQGAMRREGR